MDSLAFLERKAEKEPRPVYVLHGDERFLKRRVLAVLRTLVLGPEDDGFGVSTHAGDKANYSTVSTELVSAAFFTPRRLVVVEDADPFVTRERGKLEKYFASPSTTGVLVLDVQSWPGNTKLAKLVPEAATIVCKAPAAARLPEWCVQWCAASTASNSSPRRLGCWSIWSAPRWACSIRKWRSWPPTSATPSASTPPTWTPWSAPAGPRTPGRSSTSSATARRARR